MSYRVIKTTRSDFQTDPSKRVTTLVVWEGTDLLVLSEEHPPSNVVGADDFSFGSIEDGYIAWNHHFEMYVGGAWVVCPDPRTRLEAGSSELEDAIEEENRRLYPGDYDNSWDDFNDHDIDG